MKKNLQIITSGEQWSSSQALMDLLLEQRFAQVHEMGIFDHRATQGKYYKGGIFHFRKYGDCRIGFLKDGRVHVLNGPLSQWELFDFLDRNILRVLLAFCSLHEEHQMFFRKNMSGRKDYNKILDILPPFDAEWKRAFMEQYDRFACIVEAA